jgi:hypothetical protein
MLVGGSVDQSDACDYNQQDFAFGLTRISSTGAVVPGFGHSGFVQTDFVDDFGTYEAINAMAFQGADRVVAAGTAGPGGGYVALSRYILDGDKPNADGDAVPDAKDKCVRLPGPRGADGCPTIDRRISLQDIITFPFYGRIRSDKSRCESGQRVVLYKVRSGSDERVGRTRTDPGGIYGISRPAHRGKYYTKAPKKLVKNVGLCKTVKSSKRRYG